MAKHTLYGVCFEEAIKAARETNPRLRCVENGQIQWESSVPLGNSMVGTMAGTSFRPSVPLPYGTHGLESTNRSISYELRLPVSVLLERG